MIVTKAFIELTQEQLNTLITAAHVRMSELQELYGEAKASGQNADWIRNEYLRLKSAAMMLEQPTWRDICI